MASLPLGNLVRLTPLRLDELPLHSSLPDSTQHDPTSMGEASNGAKPTAPKGRPLPQAFLKAILDEGRAFIEAFPRAASTAGTKASQPSTANVEILKHQVTASDLNSVPWKSSPILRSEPSAAERSAGEFWAARHSIHDDDDTQGSASWDQFEFGLREDHSKHEMDFTPTLYDARTIVDWAEKLRATGSTVDEYTNVHMSVHEMCHRIPAPLNPRCFPVLVVTATLPPSTERSFIAVTVPVDIHGLPDAFYSNRRNTTEGSNAMQRKAPVLGVYTAVETVRKLPGGKVDWLMATASDAKGVLPLSIQKMSIPGAVAKDVGFFMSWVNKDVRKQ